MYGVSNDLLDNKIDITDAYYDDQVSMMFSGNDTVFAVRI